VPGVPAADAAGGGDGSVCAGLALPAGRQMYAVAAPAANNATATAAAPHLFIVT
jgi:hypothetical protein